MSAERLSGPKPGSLWRYFSARLAVEKMPFASGLSIRGVAEFASKRKRTYSCGSPKRLPPGRPETWYF